MCGWENVDREEKRELTGRYKIWCLQVDSTEKRAAPSLTDAEIRKDSAQ